MENKKKLSILLWSELNKDTKNGIAYCKCKQNREICSAFGRPEMDHIVYCSTAFWQCIKQTTGIRGTHWVLHRDRQFVDYAIKESNQRTITIIVRKNICFL